MCPRHPCVGLPSRCHAQVPCLSTAPAAMSAVPAAPGRPGGLAAVKLRRWIPVLLACLMVFSGFTCTQEADSRKQAPPEVVQLPRMIYAQPLTLSQSRTDVLTMTPWFAPIIWEGTYNLDILNEHFKRRNVSIGLTVFAIKKYVVFLQHFLETAEKLFMVGHNVSYYVFTDLPDQVPKITLAAGRQVVPLKVPAFKRWQDVSMRRMEMIHNASSQIFRHEVDYIVAVDVDMQFTDLVGVEILGDLFGTLHPGFYGSQRQHFTYERRPDSQAYIPGDEGDFYYAGGFFGGSVKEVHKLTGQCHSAIMRDKDRGIEAIWHDESHLNKYLLYHKPTKILSPEYLWPDGNGAPEFFRKKRFMALQKNHAQIRNKRESNRRWHPL